MSAIGTKQTLASAPHMSAFGGKADIFDGEADITSAAKSNSGAPLGRERLSISSDNRVYRILRPTKHCHPEGGINRFKGGTSL